MRDFLSWDAVKKMADQLFWELIGSIFIAVGIYNFAVQAKFPMTGFSGISIILYRLLHVPIGLSTIILNIPVAILCYRQKNFQCFSSVICAAFSSSPLAIYTLACSCFRSAQVSFENVSSISLASSYCPSHRLRYA